MKTKLYARESVAFDETVAVLDSTGAAVDITGWTFAAVFARHSGSPDLTLGTVAAGSEGFTVVDGPNGSLRLRITAASLAGIADTTGNFTMFADLIGSPSGNATPLTASDARMMSDLRLTVTSAGEDFAGSTASVVLDAVAAAVKGELVALSDDATASAAVALAAAGPNYTTDAAGLGAVAEGGTYPLDPSDGYIWVKKKVSGVATLLRKYIKDPAAATAAALMGADDGASGAKWGTIGGFIAYLLASTGASAIGVGAGSSLEDAQAGRANIRARTALTAAALETLAASYDLVGYAGDTHTVETAPYIQRDGFQLIGNGAILHNTNATDLATNDQVSMTLPLGHATYVHDIDFATYAIAGISGAVLTVAAGDGDDFAADDKVWVHGAAGYTDDGGHFIYRNHLRGRVVSATSTTIVLDRLPDPDLLAEIVAGNAVIANMDQATPVFGDGTDGARMYFLHAPKVGNVTLTSDKGQPLRLQGVIDGEVDGVTLDGRTGIGCNGAQDCLIENVRGKVWRKFADIAWGSRGVTQRNVRLALQSAADHGDTLAGFGLQIAENSADCLLDDWVIDSGANDFGSDKNAVQLGAGARNRMQRFIARFPAHTGFALAITSNSTAGNPAQDCGYEDWHVTAPVCASFLKIGDTGAGVVRPYTRRMKFFGTPSSGHAAQLGNALGSISGLVMEDLWFEDGDCYFVGGTNTNWIIRRCYFPDGFNNLTAARLKSHRIYDNDSDRNRRNQAAAFLRTPGAGDVVTTTTSNAAYGSATFAAGDLKAGMHIYVRSSAKSTGAGAFQRNGRVSVTCNGTTFSCGNIARSAANQSMGFDHVIEVLSDTKLAYHGVKPDGTVLDDVITVTSGDGFDANGLTVTMEYWNQATSTDTVTVYDCRIVLTEDGMWHQDLR